jgi:hypothetical protein
MRTWGESPPAIADHFQVSGQIPGAEEQFQAVTFLINKPSHYVSLLWFNTHCLPRVSYQNQKLKTEAQECQKVFEGTDYAP